MKVKTFILDNISFNTDPANRFNKTTTFFNSLGNFLLSPARHLFQGKRVTCVLVPIDAKRVDPMFGKIDDRRPEGLERVCKTIASIVLIVPGTILGAAVKGFTMLASDRLKRRYESLEKMENVLKENCAKEAEEVAICLYQKDSSRLFSILKNLKDKGQLDDFIRYFSNGGNHAFLAEYPNLYQIYGNRVLNRYIEHVIGCFLKLYAEGKIQISDFFDKMKQLDQYAETGDYSEMQRKFDPIQSRIDLSSNLSTMTTKVEEYLREKNFFQ